MLLLHAIYFMYTAQLEVHTRDQKEKKPKKPKPTPKTNTVQDLILKRDNIHLPPAESCSAGTF